jgi:hypothetical protein
MKVFLTFVVACLLTLSASAQTLGLVSSAPMTNSEFNGFLQSAKAQGLQSADRETVPEIFANTSNHFSTAQVRKLLSAIDKDSGRLAVARLLYNRVTDRANYAQLSNMFKLGNYRDEFNMWLKDPDIKTPDV